MGVLEASKLFKIHHSLPSKWLKNQARPSIPFPINEDLNRPLKDIIFLKPHERSTKENVKLFLYYSKKTIDELNPEEMEIRSVFDKSKGINQQEDYFCKIYKRKRTMIPVVEDVQINPEETDEIEEENKIVKNLLEKIDMGK